MFSFVIRNNDINKTGSIIKFKNPDRPADFLKKNILSEPNIIIRMNNFFLRL